MKYQITTATLQKQQEKLEEIQKTIACIGDTVNPPSPMSNDMYGSKDAPKMASKADLDNFASTVYQNIDLLHRMLGKMSDAHYQDKYKMEDKMYSMMADHVKGHLPKISSAEQMERAVKGLGLDKEYQIHKKTIYASDGRASKWILEWDLESKE